ncbi:MAG: O-antigen ligase family protein [Candidatus Aenigmarchaeota archaeon]|nr:O-antigen ligase family protein [Candidatus Aenigmarchaeota archaeon]
MFVRFLFILFCLFFFYLAEKKIIWAIAFICAFLPSYLIRGRLLLFSIPLTLLEIMILILFFVWLHQTIRDRLSFRKIPLVWLISIIVWLVVATIALFVSPDLRAAAGRWKAYFIEPILFLVVLFNVVKTKQDRRLIFIALGLSAFYLSLGAIYQYITGQGMISLEAWPNQLVRRATSFFSDPNFLGLYLGPVVILIVGQLIEQFNKKQKKQFWLIVYYSVIIILSLLAIIFARSEGALAGVIIGLILLGLYWRVSRRWVIIALIICSIFIIVLTPVRSFLWQKVTLRDFSGQIRLRIWRETAIMLSERPLFGAGLAGYPIVMQQYHQPFYSQQLPLVLDIQPFPHNLLLSVWSELGILGLLIFIIIIIRIFQTGISTLKKTKNNKLGIISLLVAMITILIHGLVDTPYFKNDLSVLFWIIIGLGMVISCTKKQGEVAESG